MEWLKRIANNPLRQPHYFDLRFVSRYDTCFLMLGADRKEFLPERRLKTLCTKRAGKRAKKVLRSCNCDQDFPHGECSDTDRYLSNGRCRCTVTRIYLSIYLCVLFNALARGANVFRKVKNSTLFY